MFASLTAASFIRIIRAVSGPITPPVCRNTAAIATAELPLLTSWGKTQEQAAKQDKHRKTGSTIHQEL